MDLFRKKAVDHQRQKLWGDVLIISPPSIGLISFFISAFIFIIAVYLYLGKYSLKVSGVGELVPTSGVAKVYAPKVGSVANLFVSEGDSVRKGDRLFSIEVNRVNENGEAADYAIVETVKQKLALITTNQDNEKRRYDSALNHIIDNEARNKKSLVQVLNQIELQKAIISDTQAIIDETGTLVEQGYFSRAEYSRQKIELLNHTKQLSSFKRQVIELENQIGRAANDKDELSVGHDQNILVLDRDRLSLKEQLLSLENERFTYIVAPRDGIVSGLQVVEGSTVSGRIPLLSIVPKNQLLHAYLYVPASAIGFIEKDQVVKLSFDAYDYRKFGTYSGRVESITDVLFTPSETPSSVTLNGPSYRLEVKLDQQFVDAYGKTIPLKPNMHVKADIVLASRRLYEWFLDPFIRFQRAG
ncbi:HlyD family secretion protein [Agaribacter marinus]|uniref:Secretion protein n=1 Tax=Agaribacter marinus TaxID=1431249 RepID=A0AA37T287_9ALTE|nr:HlyD family efflux transporter periplasmic adaptor subunit [Agaribacter marinus]GLR72570.1 secretion protein [Agaribacter marinus]